MLDLECKDSIFFGYQKKVLTLWRSYDYAPTFIDQPNDSVMTNKERYAQLCQEYPDINLFMQEWWLSAVCAGKQWDVLFSYDKSGNIQGALPYLIRKRMLMRYIIMPQQTQIGGIWIRPDYADRSERVKLITEDLVAQLKQLHLAYYYQQYAEGNKTVDAMVEQGFKKRERVSYRIDDLSDMQKIIDSFSKNKKRQLQKALSLHVDYQMSDEEFYRFHTLCLRQQKKRISYTREFFLVLARQSMSRHQGQIIAIKDEKERTAAAAFVVWDSQQMYYLIPCYSPEFKDSGAGALLVLEALKLAQKVTRAFDFEGSMIRGVANHYKQFGSTPHTYYSVRKYYKPLFAFFTFLNRISVSRLG